MDFSHSLGLIVCFMSVLSFDRETGNMEQRYGVIFVNKTFGLSRIPITVKFVLTEGANQ